MNKEFVPYEQALELLKLGFTEECFSDYSVEKQLTNKWSIGLIPAPLYQQAFRWFREKYSFTFSIGRTNICVYHTMVGGTLLTNMIQDCASYEEAELKCLKEFIEIAKQI